MMLQKKQQAEQMPVPTLGDVDAGALVAGSSQQTSVLEAVTRQEIDLQISTAKRYPRNITGFVNSCIAQATLDPEIAQSLFYSVPVGKGMNGKQLYADGPSIRLAELVAANYKNLRYSTDIISEDEKSITARAMVMDLENNAARSFTHSESVVGTNGRRYSDRQIERIKDVAQSKALRKAIFTVVPAALIKPVISAARSLLEGQTASLASRKANVVGWIKSLRIDAKRVWTALGIAGADDLTPADIEQLTAIYQAIAAGETTVDDAFPVISKFTSEPEAATAEAAATLFGGGKHENQPVAESAASHAPAPSQQEEIDPEDLPGEQVRG